MRQFANDAVNNSVLSGVTSIGGVELQSKALKIIDSSRVKLKAGTNLGSQQQLNKNMKLSPYQINFNSNNQ